MQLYIFSIYDDTVFRRMKFCFLLFSCSVMSNSLWSHRLQHARLPCPSPSHGACSNSCASNWWCHPNISSSVVPFSSCLQSFPVFSNLSQSFLIFPRVFSNESALYIRWPKYQSFSFSPSNQYSGLISFKIDWFVLLAVKGTLKSLFQYHSLKASVLQHWDSFMV